MTQIHDLHGYCPLGCGQTLHLMPGGLIVCLDPECPDAGALQKIIGDRETGHIVTTEGLSSHTVHPVRERIGNQLLTCGINQAIEEAAQEGVIELNGTYRVTRDGTGWNWELAGLCSECGRRKYKGVPCGPCSRQDASDAAAADEAFADGVQAVPLAEVAAESGL